MDYVILKVGDDDTFLNLSSTIMVAAVRGRKRPERPKNFVPSANM